MAGERGKHEMTNTQLYLAIGVPLIFNAIFNALLIGFFWSHMNSRFEAMNAQLEVRFQAINTRFDDMRDLWRAELKEVKDVFDVRLQHLEERR